MEPNNRWVSAVIGHDQYKTEITTDTHHLLADEPLENGGQDLAPAPTDYLRISLATCTAITLRMYANRKGYNVQRIEVKVYTDRLDDKTIFYREVKVDGNIDEPIRKRMVQIANACPVHKILTLPIEIETRFL